MPIKMNFSTYKGISDTIDNINRLIKQLEEPPNDLKHKIVAGVTHVLRNEYNQLLREARQKLSEQSEHARQWENSEREYKRQKYYNQKKEYRDLSKTVERKELYYIRRDFNRIKKDPDIVLQYMTMMKVKNQPNRSIIPRMRSATIRNKNGKWVVEIKEQSRYPLVGDFKDHTLFPVAIDKGIKAIAPKIAFPKLYTRGNYTDKIKDIRDRANKEAEVSVYNTYKQWLKMILSKKRL